MATPPTGMRYIPSKPDAELVARLHALRERHTNAYRDAHGTRLGLTALACSLLDSYLPKARVWRLLVEPDARVSRAYRESRAVLPLMVPEDLADRLDAAAALDDDWCRVGVVSAVLTAALDRVELGEARAAAGDRRAARQVERLVLASRPDLRIVRAPAAA